MKKDAICYVMENKGIDGEPEEGNDALKRIIGERVKWLREHDREAVSQDGLAGILRQQGINVKQGQIGHIEAGRRLPSVGVLMGIADHYATSLDYITGRTKNQSSIADIEEDLQTGGVSGRLGEIYKRLPKERQEEVYNFAQALDLLSQGDDAPDAELSRFVRAMLDAFGSRIGTKEVELALSDLAREFPDLASGFGIGIPQPPKKKRG